MIVVSGLFTVFNFRLVVFLTFVVLLGEQVDISVVLDGLESCGAIAVIGYDCSLLFNEKFVVFLEEMEQGCVLENYSPH